VAARSAGARVTKKTDYARFGSFVRASPQVAGDPQQEGIIEYIRRQIRILDDGSA
jgi:hypothetical protein